MCPPPCGPRGRSYHRSRAVDRTISKATILHIIENCNPEVFFRNMKEKIIMPFSGDLHEIVQVINNEETTVRVLDGRNQFYRYGYLNIIVSDCSSKKEYYVGKRMY